ncbi:non-heme iron oxygenase ferredoxin subunit [candidate division WWE3 bacterium]|nr:non-heme iron oxygenase ferredoxin subunit [candidate division WWE3 bacterium]
MSFVKVATLSEVPKNSIRPFDVLGVPIAVANLNGNFYAIANVCTHDGGPLGEGEVVDECCVECPRHGAKFELATGKVVALPATQPVDTYEVRIDGEDILVQI